MLKMHIKRSHFVECMNCKQMFNNQRALRLHKCRGIVSKIQMQMKFTCTICDTECSDAHSLENHVKSHYLSKQCKKCNGIFETEEGLQNHQCPNDNFRNCHNFNMPPSAPGPQNHPQQQQSQFHPQQYNQYYHTPAIPMPFYPQNDNQNGNAVSVSHKNDNQNDKKKLNCQFCTLKTDFKDFDALKTHLENMHQRKICPRCQNVFTTASNLKVHIRAIHDGVRKQKCGMYIFIITVITIFFTYNLIKILFFVKFKVYVTNRLLTVPI